VDKVRLALVVGLGALGLCAALVPLSRFLARRLGVLDAPGPRKVHAVPTPRMGGLAVFLSFTTIVLLGYAAAPALAARPEVQAWFGRDFAFLQDAPRVEAKLLALLFGATLAFGVGLADDILGTRFPVGVKAAGQLVAAAVLIAADIRISFLPADWMNAVVTLLWVVGITNAFNLLDNMDGLSAGVAFVASAVLLINAWFLGEFFISLVLLAFMGSLLGFLCYNWNPASIFLGDCGSLFIGYVLASLTLLERYVSHASSSYFPILMPVLVLAVPLLDTATVIVIRLREGRPIYVGDRRHLSHRLVALGLTPKAAVLVIYLITFCLGLGAASLADATVGETTLILLQSAAFVALILILMFFERRETPAPAPDKATT
jgi:UDP-GlcNAc:undecaprenyl-phosphate/decaprenyl-phosphate GlcNAc-1-phosphate transferase